MAHLQAWWPGLCGRFEISLTKFCSLGPLQVFVELYMWFSFAVIQSQVLMQRAEAFVSLNQQSPFRRPSIAVGTRCGEGLDQRRLT